jgi:cytochrome c2
MIRTSQFALFALMVAAMMGGSSVAQAQGMAAEVERGKSLWLSKSCDACHSIGGGNRAGPDLKGVTQRRTKDWLRKWLHDPDEMRATDPLAQQIYKEAKRTKMWNPHLSDADIESLIAYIGSTSKR